MERKRSLSSLQAQLLKKCCWTPVVEVGGEEVLVGQREEGVI